MKCKGYSHLGAACTITMSVAWSRLIRFVPKASPSLKPIYGEPVLSGSEQDIGKLADSGHLQAKIISCGPDGPLSPSATVTDEVVSVGKLLGPLDTASCTDLKCIGLNYKKHSERIWPFLDHSLEN